MNEWNQEEVRSFIETGSCGLIYFYTPLCGTCQVASKMLQVVNEIIEWDIGKVNLNFCPYLAVSFAIESVPCLLFIKEGRIAEKIYAFHSVPFLIDKINTTFKTDV